MHSVVLDNVSVSPMEMQASSIRSYTQADHGQQVPNRMVKREESNKKSAAVEQQKSNKRSWNTSVGG
jgi:hypothetical protein